MGISEEGGQEAAEEHRRTEETQTKAGEEGSLEADVNVRKARKRRAGNLAPESKERDSWREQARAKNRKTEQERRDRIHEGLQALREVLPLVHSKMDQQQLLRHAARYITATKSLLHQAQALGAMAGWPEPQQAAVSRLLSQDSYPADGLGQGVRSTAISLQGPPSLGSEGHSSPSKGTKGLLASGQDMEKLTLPLAAVALKGQLPGGLEGSSTSGTSGTANTRSLEGNTSSAGLQELTAVRLGLRCPGSLDGARPLGDPGPRFLPGDPSMATSGHGSEALQPMQIDSPSRLPEFMSCMEARDPSVGTGGGSPQLGTAARTQSQSLPPGIPRTPFGEGTVRDIASSPQPDFRSRSMSQPSEYEAILRSGGTGSKPTFLTSQPRKSRLASRGSVPVHLPSTGRPAPPLLQRAPSWGPPAVPSERWGLWETSAPMPLPDPGFSAFNMAQPQETLQALAAGGTTAPHLSILGGGPSEYEKPHQLPVMGTGQGPGGPIGARPGSPIPQMPEQPPWTPPRAPDSVLQFSPWQGLGTMQYMYSPPLAGVPQQSPGQQQQGGSFVQQVGDMNVNPQGYIMHLHPPTSQQAPQGFPYPAYGFSLPTSPMGTAPAHPYVGPPGSLLTYSAVLPGQASGYAVYSPDQAMGSTGTVGGIPAPEGYPGFRGGQGISTAYATGQAYNLQGQEALRGQLQYAPGPPQQRMQYSGGTSSAQQDMLMQQQMSYQMQPGFGGGGVAGGMVQYMQPGVQYMQPGAQASAVPGFPSQMQEGRYGGRIGQGIPRVTSGIMLPPGPPEEHLPQSRRRGRRQEGRLSSEGAEVGAPHLEPPLEEMTGGIPHQVREQDSFPQSMLHILHAPGSPRMGGAGGQSPVGDRFPLPNLSGDSFLPEGWHREGHLSNSFLPDLPPDPRDQQAESRRRSFG